MASNLNPISRIQKWMDTLAGQTFMNYAYSWGAAVVILGTLFKLLHLNGANLMLCIGMGTEVFVFIISGFERMTEKVPESEAEKGEGQGKIYGGSAPIIVQGGEGAAEGQPIVVQGGGSVAEGQPIVIGQPATVAASVGADINPAQATKGEGLSAAAANLAAAGQAAAQAQLALSQLQQGGVGVDPSLTAATDPSEVEEAVKNYAQELKDLTEVLGRVKDQAARMSTDSEEMENLNRTLTGIATVYELQLRNISKQVSTIEQIDEQTRRMAQQIEELNNVYGRMIKALTVNMRPVTGAAPEAE